MTLDWEDGALAEGCACYRRREFFEAHEHWESVWLRCDEPDKTFLQALIQITAAFHHLRRQNRAGAISLLNSALRRLDRFPQSYAGVEVESIRESVRTWLAALANDSEFASLPFPPI